MVKSGDAQRFRVPSLKVVEIEVHQRCHWRVQDVGDVGGEAAPDRPIFAPGKKPDITSAILT